MTDRPILFKASMVQGLLDGRKSQTRRILKQQPSEYCGAQNPPPSDRAPRHDRPYFDRYHKGPFWCWWDEYDRQGPDWVKVNFAVGDRLWVKETWAVASIFTDCAEVRYRASENRGHFEFVEQIPIAKVPSNAAVTWPKWKSSLFMPRAYSRLTLAVTNLRVERLQAISEADCLAEGAEIAHAGASIGGPLVRTDVPHVYATPRCWYRELWDKINGAGAWDENPWVVAVSFDVVRGNIDQVPA